MLRVSTRCASIVATVVLAPIYPAPTAQGAVASDRESRLAAPDRVRPGPEILYASPPRAPQLENAPGSIWTERPLLVSGGSAYRDGEFLYQGFLFDDHGAAGVLDPTDPFFFVHPSVATKTGTLTYPTAPRYAGNAADLVEFRVRALDDATAFRVTLNTMHAPERSAFTVAIGGDAGSSVRAWPHGAGVSSPAELFLTVHGAHAELVHADSGRRTGVQPEVQVDRLRRQVQVLIPHDAWMPGRSTVRLAAGVGLWDVDAARYLQPQAVATAEAPGGAADSGAALFDLAFRSDAERKPDWRNMGVGRTAAEAIALFATVETCWWRECGQAAALAAGDVSMFHADVDFAKLRDRVRDSSDVPRTGSLNRIFASRLGSGHGIDYTGTCDRFPASCRGIFASQLVPYNIYVPRRRVPLAGWGLTLLLHGGNANHNQYMGSRHQVQLGERAAGSVVLTPSGRGPFGDYSDVAEADVFEAWADVRRHYRLDRRTTVISGYSMGGGGTYKLIQRWPDLFARGAGVAAVPKQDAEQQRLDAMLNVPILTWVGDGDEGTPVTSHRESIAAMTEAGLRFVLNSFQGQDHLTLALNDEYGELAEFLGDHQVVRNPSRIRYVVDPRNDHARSLVVADHAYWLSGLRAVGSGADPRGYADVRSNAFGTAEPEPLPIETGRGVLMGGNHGASPYLQTRRTWAPAAKEPRRDLITADFRGLAAATIDVERAGLTCNGQLQVTTSTRLTLSAPACGRTWVLEPGSETLQLSGVVKDRSARETLE